MLASWTGEVVIDTNIVRILADERGTDRNRYYAERLAPHDLVISFVTEYEVLHGMELAGWSRARRSEVMSRMMNYRVIDGHSGIVQAAVGLSVLCRRQPLSFQDLFIASTAYALGCPLATDDRKLVEQLSIGGFHNVISRYAVGGDAVG